MNKFVLLIFVSTFLISCQSVKDGLTGVKRNNSDEFLIEKKNPLIQPPEYGKLPTPEKKIEDENQTKVNELEQLLKNTDMKKKKKSTSSEISSIEEHILEKINENN